MTITIAHLDKDASVLPAKTVAKELQTDLTAGLTSAEAATRLKFYGPNELRTTTEDPAWRRFLRQFADPLVYLLLVAIAISTAAWILEGAHGVPVDAIVILVIVLANAIIGFVQENKAAGAVAALASMTAARATVLRDGLLAEIPSADVVPGDVLVLAEGDAVAADARLFEAAALSVQEASLTGESEAVTKDTAVLRAPAQLGDRTNMVFKGTAVAHGVGRAVVVSTGMNTEVGKVATLLDETERDASPLQQQIAQVSRALGLVVIVIAIGVMATLALVNGVSSAEEGVSILLMGVSLAVAAVPEGLPAILSLVLAIGVQSMARRNAVMKNLDSAETLGSVSVICSDKTGTLTKNEMTLREVVTASGRTELSGAGYEPVGTCHVAKGDPGRALPEAESLLRAGAIANNAQLAQVDGSWEVQGDPTEAAFLVAAAKLDSPEDLGDAAVRLAEAPFDSERKMMSVLIRTGDGKVAVVAKGAPDVLLGHCYAEQVGETAVPLTARRRTELDRVVEELNEQGYRTLGVAWRSESDADPKSFGAGAEKDLTFAGVVGIIDPPRQEAAEAIAAAHRAGIGTVMITGDHPVTATRIARDLGILTGGGSPTVITGHDLEQMGDAELAESVGETRVFARVSPEHKLRIVDALQANQRIVAMTGDGVNDAPALKSADIGIAMGITGTEVTKEAADMILGDDNYATIVAAVEQGRVIFDNIKKFIRYLLSSNMGEVATVFLGVVLGGVIGLADPAHPGATVVPLLATQILWINLVTDSGPALAMGVDSKIDDVMARPPRRMADRIIDRAMWTQIISVGLVMGFLSLAVLDLTLPGGLVSGMDRLVPVEDQLPVARTTMFTGLVFMQLFNALNSRSADKSAFSHLFTNRWLWLSLAGATLAQVLVVEVPLLQRAFGTASIGPAHWALAVGAGAAVLLFEEVVKLFRRSVN